MRILCLLAAVWLQLATGPLMAQRAIVNSQVVTRAGEALAAVVVQAGERQAVIHSGLWPATDWGAAARYVGDIMTEFDRVSPGLRATPIQVLPASALGPEVNYPVTMERDGHTDIHLATAGNAWCQMAFQFSHEYLHYLLARPYREADRFGWFEETLAELASLYALHQLPNYQSGNTIVDPYRAHFPDYAHLRARSNPVTIPGHVCSFVGTHLNHLSAERYDREKNLAMAGELLPRFLEQPDLWAAVPYLRQVADEECADFGDYLDAWVAATPPAIRSRSEDLRDLLHPDCQSAEAGLAIAALP